MIGYWNFNILFGVENKIYYFNVAKDIEAYDPKNEETENKIRLPTEQIHFTTNSDGYYPVLFTAVDEHTTCLVVAN